MNQKHRFSPLVATARLAAATLASHGQPLRPVDNAPAYVPGEVLVQFKSTVTNPELADAFRQGQLNLLQHLQTPAMQDHGLIGLTRATTTLPVEAAIRALKNHPSVKFAEPNWVASPASEADDPFYTDGSLWGMYGDDLPFPIAVAADGRAFDACVVREPGDVRRPARGDDHDHDPLVARPANRGPAALRIRHRAPRSAGEDHRAFGLELHADHCFSGGLGQP